MSSEPPTFVDYPRTGNAGGMPATPSQDLWGVASGRRFALAALVFGIVGLTILMTYGAANGWYVGKPTVTLEKWFAMAMAQALSAYMLSAAMTFVQPASDSLYRSKAWVVAAGCLLPFGGLVAPLVVVVACDRYFKRRGIAGYFVGPRDDELTLWVETFGEPEPEPTALDEAP